jgi:methylase of polypeptide subunit release factors
MDFYVDILRDDIFRKKYGAHFTPEEVVKKMCDKIVDCLPSNINWNSFKILDIASGTGIFSYYISQCISTKYNKDFISIINNNCVMVEIDTNFVDKCREIYKDLKCSPTIIHDDALFNDTIINSEYDVVVGNPPYIRIQNIDSDYRNKLRDKYKSCKFGSSDIYYAFTELSIHILRKGGVLGLITPSSYLRTDAGKYIRELLSDHIYSIEDNGSHKYFGCDTYTAFTYAIKDNNSKTFYYSTDINETVISKKDLNLNKFIIGYNDKGLLLKNVCKFRGGIATLRDNIFIIKPDFIEDGFIHYKNYKLELKSTVNLVKISELKKSDDVESNTYRCIFPYKGFPGNYDNFDTSQEFHTTFPNTFEYLESFKEELLKRDKGVHNGYRWFEFGRTQGLSYYNTDCIVTSTMNKYPLFIKATLKDTLVRSGIVLFDINYDIDKLLHILNSDKMYEFIYNNGSKYGDGWRGYNRKILEVFSIEN